MNIGKILIILGKSQYDVFDIFSKSIAEGFEECGAKVKIIDTYSFDFIDLETTISNSDLIFAFNGAGINNSKNFKRLMELIDRYGILCWTFLLDSPTDQHTRLLDTRLNQIYSVIDRKHLMLIDKYYKNISHKVFIPHGASLSGEDDISFENKKYEISFFGTYVDPREILKKMQHVPENLHEILISTVEDLWEGNKSTLEESLIYNLNKNNIYVKEEDVADVLFEFSFLGDYVRYEKRNLLIKSALETGRDVHVFGRGWERFSDTYPNLTVHGNITYSEVMSVMANTKIVLNNLPNFADGSHERIFTAIASGSICLTDGNQYLHETLDEGDGILYYKWNEIDKIQEIIENILDDEKKSKEMIQKGKKKVLASEMWKNRAKKILDYCKNIKPQEKKADIALFDYIEDTDNETLYHQIRSRYGWHAYYNRAYTDRMGESMKRYGFWGSWNPDQGDYGVIKERVNVLKKDLKKIKWLFKNLSDDISKEVLSGVLMNWITFHPVYLKNITDYKNKHYFDKNILSLSNEEVFVDLGAYNGDTARDFIEETQNRFRRLYCYEPSKRNLKELNEQMIKDERIIVRPCAVGDENKMIFVSKNEDSSSDRITNDKITNDDDRIEMVTLDRDIREKITFIKSDIEGAEMMALNGARIHIIKEHPKLAISVYHGNTDLYNIAEHIYMIDSSYRFYMRYYGGELYPNEIVLYAL